MNQKNGFTLIELLIVIAIIGILSSLILPNYTNIKNKSKETSLKSIGHTLQIALEAYYLNNDSYPTSDMDSESLIETLIDENALASEPENPFTNTPFTSSDTSGSMIYTYDSDNQSYTLDIYGHLNKAIILSLSNDS